MLIPYLVRVIISIALFISDPLVASFQGATLDYPDSNQQLLAPYESNDERTDGPNRISNVGIESVGPRSFYMIGNRVLVKTSVYDAVKNGANAVEIDMTADRDGG